MKVTVDQLPPWGFHGGYLDINGHAWQIDRIDGLTLHLTPANPTQHPQARPPVS